MAAILALMRQRIDRGELVLEEDLGFHDLLVQATHNPLLAYLYACLTPFLVAVREGGELTTRVLDECLTDHTAIYEAIRDRDAARAIRLMQEHMESVRRQLADDRQS
jgi:DNA-binding FadR family transcriptional regulator